MPLVRKFPDINAYFECLLHKVKETAIEALIMTEDRSVHATEFY